MTVNKSNLPYVGDVYAWARENAALVELALFIAFKIPENITGEERAAIASLEIKAEEIIAAISEKDKAFKLCGSVKSPFSGVEKWSVAAAFCGREEKFVSPWFLAAAQELSRRWRGRYLGRLFKMSFWETTVSAILLLVKKGVTLGDVRALFRGVQAVAIVQPETIIWNQKPRFFL